MRQTIAAKDLAATGHGEGLVVVVEGGVTEFA